MAAPGAGAGRGWVVLAVFGLAVAVPAGGQGSAASGGAPDTGPGGSPLPSLRVPGQASDFMESYIARRVAQVWAELERSQQQPPGGVPPSPASVAEWDPPAPPPGSAAEPYVDLAAQPGWGLQPQGMSRTLPRVQPSVRFPAPAPPAPFCPEQGSVRTFGARGDASTDDSCIYRVVSDVVITKPLYMGRGAQFLVDKAGSLTITTQPRLWDSGMALFAGEGPVRFQGQGLALYPTWFKNWIYGESDSDALQQTVDSCQGTCTLMMHFGYSASRPLKLRPNIGVFSSGAAGLWSDQGNKQGVILRPGRYSLPVQLGNLMKFSGAALSILGGVRGANIQLCGAHDSGDAIRFAPHEGVTGSVSDVAVSHFVATSAVQNTVVLEGTHSSQLLRNVHVRGNFVVGSGSLRPQEQSAGLLIRGPVAPRLELSSVAFQAVDPVQDRSNSQFVMLQNTARRPAVGVQFGVEAWGGGLTKTAMLAKGVFRQLGVRWRMSGGIPDTHTFGLGPGSRGNWVTADDVGTAAYAYSLQPKPFEAGELVKPQVFFFTAPVEGAWRPGEVRSFFFDSIYTPTTAEHRMRCLPFRAVNRGIVCAGFKVRPDLGPMRVELRLRNSAWYAINAQQHMGSVRLAAQIGP